MLAADDRRVVALVEAVRSGDLAALGTLLAEHPELATERFGDGAMSTTCLHVATDWPGNFPNVADTIALLVRAGAVVDARFAGPHAETPLHWAASSDDVDAIDALLDAGADIEAPGGVLTDGPPMDDAIVFAQYRAARRLAERGAATDCWQDAPLGHVDRVGAALAGGSLDREEITNSAWHAARAGQAGTLALLIDAGADLTAVLWEERTILDAALVGGDDETVALLRRLGAASNAD